MRIFSCLLYRSSTPDLLHIMTADEERARVLARREFLAANAAAVRLHDELNKLLWSETAEGAAPGAAPQGAGWLAGRQAARRRERVYRVWQGRSERGRRESR
jgi:hypothetical protein